MLSLAEKLGDFELSAIVTLRDRGSKLGIADAPEDVGVLAIRFGSDFIPPTSLKKASGS